MGEGDAPYATIFYVGTFYGTSLHKKYATTPFAGDKLPPATPPITFLLPRLGVNLKCGVRALGNNRKKCILKDECAFILRIGMKPSSKQTLLALCTLSDVRFECLGG